VRVFWLIPLACWLGLSAIVWSATDAAYTTCRNALVGALDPGQCATVTMWHDLAGWCALAALAALGLAGLRLWDQAREGR
jgi:hypothetical protein